MNSCRLMFWGGIVICAIAAILATSNAIDGLWGMMFINGVSFVAAATASWLNYGL